MGSAPPRIFSYRNRHLLTFMLFLLITSRNPFKITAEGRVIPKLRVQSLEANNQKKLVEENVAMVRSLIGSRPPICERRCSSCGHCEAVQVPISFKHQQTRSHHKFLATPTIAYSRGDDISNYKPMRWKCKCGNFIFNP